PEEMRVPYIGRVDRAHPIRLAERIRGLANDRPRLQNGLANIAVAREKFDYAVLGQRYASVLKNIDNSLLG
ncbi:MAG TPA: hypothetical protein VH054_09135, partial [Polyangiaceae bacterium]|nr:hypothetical protein [Polyangiaceae bacterium]